MSYRHNALSEGGSISWTTGPLTGPQTLSALLAHVDTAPTTSETLTVTLDSGDGSEYDAILYSKDMASVTSISITNINMPLRAGDALTVAYDNTDSRHVGVTLITE